MHDLSFVLLCMRLEAPLAILKSSRVNQALSSSSTDLSRVQKMVLCFFSLPNFILLYSGFYTLAEIILIKKC